MQKDESCSEDAIASRAAALLDKWSALKEVYRIPKKASKLVRIKLHGGNSCFEVCGATSGCLGCLCMCVREGVGGRMPIAGNSECPSLMHSLGKGEHCLFGTGKYVK